MNKHLISYISKTLMITAFALFCINSDAQVKRKHKKTVHHTTSQKHRPVARKKTVTNNVTVTPKAVVSTDTTALPQDISGKDFTVTSSFTPTLREATKINFSNSAELPVTEKIALSYNVPAQNLVFAYRPAYLQPLAANIDTASLWRNKHFVKLGYGTQSTPYLEGGFSYGDGINSAVTLYAKHTESTGSLPLQQFSKTDINVSGISEAGKDNEAECRVYFNNSGQYEYANLLPNINYSKDSLRRRYSDFGVKVGLSNKDKENDAVNYHPTVAANVFSGNRSEIETSFVIDAPLEKKINENLEAQLGVNADLTRYKTNIFPVINNNIFYISPALQYSAENFKLHIGITPSIDESKYHLLPNLNLEAKIKDERFIVQAGWQGYYNKNTYRSLTNFNPWITIPDNLYNTRANEIYGGLKGSAGGHFTYNAKLSFIKYSNIMLFDNDPNTNEFNVIKDSLNDLKLHGDIGYNTHNFSLLAGISANRYGDIKQNDKAWGLPQISITGSLRWNATKNVLLKSDIDLMNGIYYQNTNGDAKQLQRSADWNVGAEWSVVKYVSLWAQINNLLDNKYQRWVGYPVIGTQFLGGIIINFGQLEK